MHICKFDSSDVIKDLFSVFESCERSQFVFSFFSLDMKSTIFHHGLLFWKMYYWELCICFNNNMSQFFLSMLLQKSNARSATISYLIWHNYYAFSLCLSPQTITGALSMCCYPIRFTHQCLHLYGACYLLQ